MQFIDKATGKDVTERMSAAFVRLPGAPNPADSAVSTVLAYMIENRLIHPTDKDEVFVLANSIEVHLIQGCSVVEVTKIPENRGVNLKRFLAGLVTEIEDFQSERPFPTVHKNLINEAIPFVLGLGPEGAEELLTQGEFAALNMCIEGLIDPNAAIAQVMR